MARKNDKCSYHQNKKMNNEVYKLRKEAMKYVYEAREITDLPRITIRVTDICDPRKSTALASARLNDCVVWVTEEAITNPRFDLRTIVFHELLHAVYGIEHDSLCPLMKPIHTPLTKAQCHSLFKKWVDRADMDLV